MHFIRSLFVVALLLVVSGCSSKPTGDFTVKFLGEWKVLELTENGKKASDQAIHKLYVVIQSGTFQKLEQDDANAATKIGGSELLELRVDNMKSPPEIELVRTQGADQGKMQLGIFSHEDDKLTICLGELGGDRPTEFTATPKTTLMVLERKK